MPPKGLRPSHIFPHFFDKHPDEAIGQPENGMADLAKRMILQHERARLIRPAVPPILGFAMRPAEGDLDAVPGQRRVPFSPGTLAGEFGRRDAWPYKGDPRDFEKFLEDPHVDIDIRRMLEAFLRNRDQEIRGNLDAQSEDDPFARMRDT